MWWVECDQSVGGRLVYELNNRLLEQMVVLIGGIGGLLGILTGN